MCLFVYLMYTACMFVQGCQISWNWSYRQLWAAVWVLGIQSGLFGRTASVLNCKAISPAPADRFLISWPVHLWGFSFLRWYNLQTLHLNLWKNYIHSFLFFSICSLRSINIRSFSGNQTHGGSSNQRSLQGKTCRFFDMTFYPTTVIESLLWLFFSFINDEWNKH